MYVCKLTTLTIAATSVGFSYRYSFSLTGTHLEHRRRIPQFPNSGSNSCLRESCVNCQHSLEQLVFFHCVQSDKAIHNDVHDDDFGCNSIHCHQTISTASNDDNDVDCQYDTVANDDGEGQRLDSVLLSRWRLAIDILFRFSNNDNEQEVDHVPRRGIHRALRSSQCQFDQCVDRLDDDGTVDQSDIGECQC